MKQGYNPYMPSWEYVPDGEPHVFGDRVYVYGSHDQFRGHAFCANDYICYSAPVTDLRDWRYEGVIYARRDDPRNSDGEMCLYAPDVCQGPDGRYYLYYVLDALSIVSVAVCDTPAGRYQFLGYVHYEDGTLLETLADPDDHAGRLATREATAFEIRELTEQMQGFGVSLSDVVDNCPRQERTLAACRAAFTYAKSRPDLLEQVVRTGKLPLSELAQGSGVERKTLERHRKYLLALLLICTNGYEIIRGHLHQVLKGGGKA